MSKSNVRNQNYSKIHFFSLSGTFMELENETFMITLYFNKKRYHKSNFFIQFPFFVKFSFGISGIFVFFESRKEHFCFLILFMEFENGTFELKTAIIKKENFI